eukprot:scaffold11454_cov168-Amphora_coffeaeformis.AAC.16
MTRVRVIRKVADTLIASTVAFLLGLVLGFYCHHGVANDVLWCIGRFVRKDFGWTSSPKR